MIQNIPNKFKLMACYKTGIQPEPTPIPIEDGNLIFVAQQPSNIKLSQIGSPDTITLQYNKNDTEWLTYNIGDQIDLNTGQFVKFSGANDHFNSSPNNYYQFAMTGTVSSSGNIQSLVNFTDTIPFNCYDSLFKDCTSLISVPQLPLMELINNCYQNMFYGCTGLSSVPADLLPATGLAVNCYGNMFQGCTSLTSVPTLPATKLAYLCYQNMFRQCTGLSSVPADLLPAIKLNEQCYEAMFNECSNLLNAPNLPATTLTYGCYNYMFYGCSKLSNINVSFTSWPSNTTNGWVQNVAANGTFICPTTLDTTTRDESHVPENWTVINM